MLTLFHGEQVLSQIETMDVEPQVKENFNTLVREFMDELFTISEFDASAAMGSDNFRTVVKAA